MSDFLSIAPDGWVELTEIAPYINQTGNLEEVQTWIQQEAWEDIKNLLPGTPNILKARLIYLDDGAHLWALIG